MDVEKYRAIVGKDMIRIDTRREFPCILMAWCESAPVVWSEGQARAIKFWYVWDRIVYVCTEHMQGHMYARTQLAICPIQNEKTTPSPATSPTTRRHHKNSGFSRRESHLTFEVSERHDFTKTTSTLCHLSSTP
jgi:hypothetical protein